MNRKHLIYVENISPSSTEEQLLTYLEKWGPVQQVYFLREKQCTKRSIAAFVRVACQEDLEHVMSRNQQNYRGKRLFMVAADQPQFFQADLSVIVRNITGKISEENLFDHFEDCGKITFLQIRTDDFAYICFQDKAGVRNAMAKNNLQLKTAHLKIQLLTRNVEVMIVNLETLPNRMPDLYRKMCLPVEPRTPGQQSNQKPNQQQKEEPPKAALPEPNQQQQSQQQQQNNRSNQQQQNNRSNQQQQNNRSNQQHQNNRSNQQQQNNRSNQQQQQQEQQRSNQPQPQPQQQQQQRSNQPQQQQQRSNQQQQQQQRTNQSQQQQQQKLNQPQPQQQQRSNQPQPQQQQKSNQPQPQQQQQQQRLNQQQRPNQQQKQVEQQQQRPQVPQQPPQPQRQTQLNWFMRQQKPEQQAQQQKAQSTVQILKEKANAIAAQKQQELPPVRSPAAEVTNSSPNNATSLANGQHEQPKATPTPNQQIEEIVIIDDLDPDVPESSPIPPIPSKYQPKPDDLMPPVKASELRMRNINGHNVRAVWINNIDQEVSGLDLIRYLEQFGDVEYFRFGYAQNSLFTKWAKVIFAEQESAVAACEYFLHPYNGRYLFVLSCTRSIEENPERTFFVDYLSRYIVYEDIVKAFKHIGNVFYYARVINSLRKIRIFFTTDVDVEAVLAVDKISGLPVRLERFSRNTNDKISRGQYKRIKSGRNVIPPHHKPRVSAANRSRKQELDELFSYHKDSVNPEDKKHVIGVMITNISKKTTDQEILDLFKEVGEPLAYRRQPEPHDSSERVFIQYNTLSKVWHAVKLRPAVNSFDGYTVFMYDPQRRPKMSSHDTIVLSLENPLSIQDVYNGTLEFGPIRLIEKLNSRVVKVCFKPKPDTMSKVRHIETICSVNVVKAVLYREKKHKIDGPIVIDDDDDEEEEEGIVDVTSENHVVYAVEDDNPYADAEKSETQEQQKPVQQEQQKQQQQQQTQKNQGQQKQQSSTAQQNQDKKVRNPFSGGNQLNRQNRRRPPPPRRRNVAPRGNFRNDEPMHPFERSNPSMRHELFDDRFAQIDRFDQERRMQQIFDQELPPQFSRDFDDPRQYRSRSPHHQGRVSPWQRGPSGLHGDDAGWGGDSRGIPSNIPEQDLDEYISRKQEAIQRRLEQLERQLVTSVESSREMEQYEYAAGRRQGTFFSDNGDVHYVPNPAARQQRGGGMGRNSRNARNQKRAESYRQKRAENHRTRDPFSGLDIAPIIRVPDDHSPPPKRNRGNAEEDFDTDRFNAAWN